MYNLSIILFFMHNKKNFVLGQNNFWCCCICEHKMIKFCPNIWGYWSTEPPNVGMRMHHVVHVNTAETNSSFTTHKIFNSVNEGYMNKTRLFFKVILNIKYYKACSTRIDVWSLQFTIFNIAYCFKDFI